MKDAICPLLFLNIYDIDDKGNPIVRTWPPNYYSIPFLFSLTTHFSNVVELAKVHFNKNPVLNIYLYSTNGDQARADFQGLMYWCAERKTFVYL